MATLKRLLALIQAEPAVFVNGLAALVSVLAAFGVRASPHQVAAVATIGTAVAAIVTAWMTRPVQVPVIIGAVTSIAVASAAFGLHLSAAEIGAAAPLVSLVVSLLLRQALTPVASLPKRATINLMKDEAVS